MYSRCSWLGECVVATVYCVVCVIEYGWYIGRGDCVLGGKRDRISFIFTCNLFLLFFGG